MEIRRTKLLMIKKLSITILFALAFIERVYFDLGPNIELVTVVAILASVYLGLRHAFVLTLLLIVITDLFIGNTSIFIFTWTGFLIPVIATSLLFATKKLGGSNKLITGPLAGVMSTLFFFFWTNFGVWALDSWGMYSNDLSGLTSSYINAIPFLKMQMASTLLFVPIAFLVVEGLIVVSKSHHSSLNRYLKILPT